MTERIYIIGYQYNWAIFSSKENATKEEVKYYIDVTSIKTIKVTEDGKRCVVNVGDNSYVIHKSLEELKLLCNIKVIE